MVKRISDKVVEASGGIVERAMPGGVRIALIHRVRYGSEWALPKGKRRRSESWQHNALREVKEETGLDAKITGIAGATAYFAKGVPKLVMYWRMRVAGDLPAFMPNDEVTKLDWLTPRDAIARLTHADEADLVRRVFKRTGDR